MMSRFITAIVDPDGIDKIRNEDYSSQLRCLRLILGKNFRPISTEALASLANLPVAAIRGTEAGRRVLNDEDRSAIYTYIGAIWDVHSQQWVCAWQTPEGVNPPFTRQSYEFYTARDGLIASKSLAEPNIEKIQKKLRLLTHNLPPKHAAYLLDIVDRTIQAFAAQNGASADLLRKLKAHDLDLDLKSIFIRQAERNRALEDLEEDSSNPSPKARRQRVK